MRGLRRSIAMVLCALHLAACASAVLPNPNADSEAQIDGKKMEAKPGMGRIYLVHGDIYTSSTSSPGGGGLQGGGLILMLLIGVVVEGARGNLGGPYNKAKPWEQNTNVEDYWLDEHRLGAMNGRQYMALDLTPGEYTVSYRKPGEGSLTVKLAADEVAILWSVGTKEKGGIFRCLADCPERIQDGTRIVADWPLPTATKQ